MIEPTTAPRRPTRAPFIALSTGRAIIDVTVISPIPKEVPRLVRAGIWYFLKYFLKLSSAASVNMAGLSDIKQFSIPREDAPGRSYIGFIIFETSLFTKAITPNSENIADIPPAKTATAIKYRQTFIKRSYDVSIMVLIMFVPPIIEPI